MQLLASIETLSDQYEHVREAFHSHARRIGISQPRERDVTRYLTENPQHTGHGQLSWNRTIKQYLARNTAITPSDEAVFPSAYRPFTPQWAYFDRRVNDMVYRLPSLFPTRHHTNLGFYVTGMGSDKPFSVMMTAALPDLAFWGSSNGQYLPRWTYEKVDASDGQLDLSASERDIDESGYRRVDNITDEILGLYREAAGGQVTKDDIFYYVYGQLHDPTYRTKYAADLKKMLPHIPTPQSPERFDRVVSAGRRLADLHVGYENVAPFPLEVALAPGADPGDRETWRVKKMRWAKTTDEDTGKRVNDTTTIIYNPKVTITGIPAEAERYLLGSRSALGWIIDRYQVKTDKASGITNDPNDWADEQDNPRYIVDLIKKVTTVAVQTMAIVDHLATAPGQ